MTDFQGRRFLGFFTVTFDFFIIGDFLTIVDMNGFLPLPLDCGHNETKKFRPRCPPYVSKTLQQSGSELSPVTAVPLGLYALSRIVFSLNFVVMLLRSTLQFSVQDPCPFARPKLCNCRSYSFRVNFHPLMP